jgi:2-hydroxychromene-2-carboxylate isomerase
MRGAIAAGREGVFEPYVDEVYRHMWSDPKKMDDLAVVEAALRESELPAERILQAMQDPDVKAELIANTQGSVDRGVFGSPSFFVDGELYFGKDKLREVEDAIERSKRDP